MSMMTKLQKFINSFFDAGELCSKQNNEKKEIVFDLKEIKKEENGEVYVFIISYSERGVKTKTEEIVKQTKLRRDIVEKAFGVFKKQAEVDFFINKNAKKFLNEQLDIYLHQILINTDNKFDQDRLNQLKTVKVFAQKIIDFISQFEDELVRVWNKPKFALNSNYVITIDKLSNEIVDKISKHSGLKFQIKEWQDLGIVNADFNFAKRSDKHKYLPIDTKYFKDLEVDILELFDNLDCALDGRLIRSENYQALNTLQRKYKEKIQCIYIDPPYNTDSSPIIYVNNYKDSSWLTAIHNRMSLSKSLLRDDGVNITAIDDIELRYLISLQDDIFGKDNYIATITIECNPAGRVGNKVSKTSEFHILHAKRIENINEISVQKNSEKKLTPLKRVGMNSLREERPYRYYPILIKDNKLSMISDEEYDLIFDKTNRVFNDVFVEELRCKYEKEGFSFVLPLNSLGEKHVWQRTFERVKKELSSYTIKDDNIYTPPFCTERIKTLWRDSIYVNPIYGSRHINNLFGYSNFETPKSFHTIKQFLSIFEPTGIYLDYFGGAGTTAEAVIKANKEDSGDRKYIVVEMGEHFNSVIIPRIKKICFSDKWKEGEAQVGEGMSQFFKYYSLEQYEDALRNMKYKTNTPSDFFNDKKPFEQYIFYADNKFADVLKINGEKIETDFDNLYKNIDFAETISNLRGLPIKKITKTGVLLEGEVKEIKTDCKNMTDEEELDFIRLLKPLLWWGKE
jgi:adenine-specific DNA-methyltransferase